MKWVFFLAVLVQRNCISAQPLTNENVRESRQLNLDECCPCATSDRIKDFNVLDTNNVPPDCPCRAADSETASSIFTPKIVQPFDRPFEGKEDPKPLLNPEVGLASSVLETLREVTDQEYEAALARDVARSALQVMDSDDEDMPVSASTNVFNDIFSPRDRETIDAIPEASYNEETRCIHPTLSRVNEFVHYEIQPQRNLLKDFRLSKPSSLSKNIFDMDNSPSNIQENILPAKNTFLDDIKMKTNLLKSKLFTNNKGLLQRMGTDKSFDSSYYNKHHKKIPDWKLVEEKTKDFSLNNNILRNNLQNNKKVVLIPLRKPLQTNKYETDEVLSSEEIHSPVSKEVQRFKNTKNYNKDSNADTSNLNPVISSRDDNNLKKENMLLVDTNTEKNDCPSGIDTSTSNFPVFIPSRYSTEILDTIPSPSEPTNQNKLIDATNNSPDEYNSNDNLSEVNIKPNPEEITHNTYENSKPTSNAKPTDVQDTTNNLTIDDNNVEADKYIPEIVCTPENSKSEISGFYSVATPDSTTINTDAFNFPFNQNENENIDSMNAESTNRKEETSESINNLLDKNKGNNFNIFPNIKEGLIKTFENMKNINEKLQENIKLNVQDALQLVNVKNNVVMQEQPKQYPVFIPEILDTPHKNVDKTPNTASNTLSSDELQKMSDSILTLSSVNHNSEPNLSSSSKEVSDTFQTMDSNGEASETISCLTPAEVYNSEKTEEKLLNSNNKEKIKNGSENQQHFRNLNTGLIIVDKPRKSEIPLEQSSINIKEPSSVKHDKNEMAVQASEPKPQRNTKIGLDNSRYLKQDFIAQPDNELDEFGRSLLNVNNFFDNVKTTISNAFTKTNENIFRKTEDNDDYIDNNYKINKQDRNFNFEKPKLNLKKGAKFLKSPEAIHPDTYAVERYKPNLNPYKARVAVPESFNVKPILTLDDTLDKRSRTLNNPRNILPKTYSTNTFVYNSNENTGNENLRTLFRESVHNNPNSESTILSPNILQNNFKSSGLRNVGTLKDRTGVSLQNIHKTIGNTLRAVPSKESGRHLNKNIGNENLFETMASRRNELNEKLQAINSDLNDRLSSLSHRMADSILPSSNYQPLPQRRIIAKSRSDVKNKQGLDYLRRINAPSDIKSALPKSKLNTHLSQSKDSLSVPKASKKSLIGDHLSDLKSSRMYENSMSQRRTLVKPANKFQKTETKTFKPKFKDNEMISVTTIRPKILISGLKPPQTIKKVSNLSAPSLEKNPFVSRLKSGEPHSLGSENVMSRALLDKKTDTDKSLDVSSNESDQKFISNIKDIKASTSNEARNFALSKLREVFKAKILNHNSNQKDFKDNHLKTSNRDLEIIPSASENVNKETDGSLRQNVQYKCKMLCTKDK